MDVSVLVKPPLNLRDLLARVHKLCSHKNLHFHPPKIYSQTCIKRTPSRPLQAPLEFVLKESYWYSAVLKYLKRVKYYFRERKGVSQTENQMGSIHQQKNLLFRPKQNNRSYSYKTTSWTRVAYFLFSSPIRSLMTLFSVVYVNSRW